MHVRRKVCGLLLCVILGIWISRNEQFRRSIMREVNYLQNRISERIVVHCFGTLGKVARANCEEELEGEMELSPLLQMSMENYRLGGKTKKMLARYSIEPVNENQVFNESVKQIKKKIPKNTSTSRTTDKIVEQLKKEMDIEFLLDNFYIVDSTTSIDQSLFPVKNMLGKDYSIDKDSEKILVYHTHGGSEYFSDGEDEKHSVLAAGDELCSQLEQLGYQVIHDRSKYDCIEGKLDRNRAYGMALAGVSKELEKDKQIQVVIDLHRDGCNSKERKVVEIDGVDCAQFMIFNGLCRNRRGKIEYLQNVNLKDNLAFGLQVKLSAMNSYPGITTKNYLKGYRYNQHLKKRSLLVELGNQNNTTDEAIASMGCLARVLDDVLE